jgi:uncharacterized protein (TIGR02453 family)
MMSSTSIQPSSIEFLRKLKNNNNRDWFKLHKGEYDKARENIAMVADNVLHKLGQADQISTASGAKSLYRVYRDVRFSKDKTPYNLWYSGYFRRATEALRGGYYFNIQADGDSSIAGGFWGPNKEDLKLIREQIGVDEVPLRSALNSAKIETTFGRLEGDQLKTAPKGWDKEHPSIDLLRYKQFILRRSINEKELLSSTYADIVVESYIAMRPFLDAMSMYLTTDLNGESILT